MAYVRNGARARVLRRKEWAAWHARRWSGGKEVWGEYTAAVRAGLRPVRRKNEERWRDRCGGGEGGNAIKVRRTGTEVVVTGGTRGERMAIMRAERSAGEQWDVTGKADKDGGGRGGANTRATSRQMRLTASAMARMVNGLDEPFGDG